MDAESQRFTRLLEIIKHSKRVELNPAISVDSIANFEKQNKLLLPRDYVRFITQVGDGGIIFSEKWASGELIPFSNYEQRGYSFSCIKKPFTLTESWMPDWGDQIGDSLDEEFEEQLADARWEMIHKHGTITLLENRTDNYQRWFLIVNGPCYGEVWLESEFGVLRFSNCSFSQWLLLIVQEKWEKYAEKCIAIEHEKRNKQTLAEKCLQALKEVHIVPNPPTEISVIKDFEGHHHIQLPESFIAFYTSVANGGKVRRGEFPKLYSIDELDSLENLDLPFLFQSEDQLKELVLKVKGTTEGSFSMPWRLLKQHISLVPKEENSPWIHPILTAMNGCLPLLARPKSMRQGQLFLILNGAFRGQIWSANQVELIPKVDHKFSNGEPVNVLNFLLAYSQGKY